MPLGTVWFVLVSHSSAFSKLYDLRCVSYFIRLFALYRWTPEDHAVLINHWLEFCFIDHSISSSTDGSRSITGHSILTVSKKFWFLECCQVRPLSGIFFSNKLLPCFMPIWMQLPTVSPLGFQVFCIRSRGDALAKFLLLILGLLLQSEPFKQPCSEWLFTSSFPSFYVVYLLPWTWGR